MLAHIATLAGMLGCLLIIPAVLGFFRIAAHSRAVVVGGALMIAGYVCYFSILGSSLTAVAMAEHGGPVDDFAAVLDASQQDPWGTWVFLVFVLGNLLGTALLAAGLWRSSAVPLWGALAILSWPVLHVIGLIFFGNEVPQVIGATLQAIGFAAGAHRRARL